MQAAEHFINYFLRNESLVKFDATRFSKIFPE